MFRCSKLYFSKNGTWQNSGVPTSGATGTGAVSITGYTMAKNEKPDLMLLDVMMSHDLEGFDIVKKLNDQAITWLDQVFFMRLVVKCLIFDGRGASGFFSCRFKQCL